MSTGIRHLVRFSFVLCVLALVCGPACCATKYVKTDGSDSNDGSSWALAKKTVQAGINAAVSGDEVWVAQGTYVERITLKEGVKLYGGYSGVGTTRDITTYVTTLDGNQGGSVVTSPSDATASTVIDGFRIQHGTATEGGGIYCSSSSPTILNSIITGNSASNSGGGIFCSSSSPTISNNAVTGNTAPYGGGIYCCYSSSPTISNNTIAGNGASVYAGGIYCTSSSSPSISNNILAFNSSGIYRSSTGGSPTLRNNCMYGNTDFNYFGLSAGTGDMSADPLFASSEYGNVHIQPGSPCINSGWNAAPGLAATDMDGQARMQGGTVDIGADESYGETRTVYPAIIRVASTGNDANDGSAWDDTYAKHTVQAGIDAASALGGEVWVKAGVYVERITLRPFAHVYGGFAGTETSRSGRNWAANATVLDGAAGGSVVTAKAGERMSTIDGFAIRNGASRTGGGIYLYYSSPAISNNTIEGNDATYGGGIFCYCSSPAISNNTLALNSGHNFGGGIYCESSSPTITDSSITGNTTSFGGGIYCISQSSPTVLNSTIVGNSATNDGGGIYWSYSSGIISGNTITGNSVSDYGGGIRCTSSASPTITNNRITGNTASYGGGISYSSSSGTMSNNRIAGNTASTYGGGIYCYASSPTMTNNSITANKASSGGGTYSYNSSSAISNNIVAFNSPGMRKSGTGTLSLRNNDVYGNTSYDYSGLSAGTGDISQDPRFVDRPNGDYHLQGTSLCIDAGYNSASGLPPADMDGDPRVFTTTVDIGADEYTPAPVRIADAKKADAPPSIYLRGAVVSAAFTDSFYVEADDRSSGIRVDKSAHGLSVDARTCVYGTVATDSAGERHIEASFAASTGSGHVDPVALANTNLGGGDCDGQAGVWGRRWNSDGTEYLWTQASGLNNIGLLVTICGNVTYVGADCFYVDDGSKEDDDSGRIGVKVYAPGLDLPAVSQFAWVTGVSSCEKKGADLVRVLRVRKQADIVPVP